MKFLTPSLMKKNVFSSFFEKTLFLFACLAFINKKLDSKAPTKCYYLIKHVTLMVVLKDL
jgi:hypothetical protein